jgi:hypothetical protein
LEQVPLAAESIAAYSEAVAIRRRLVQVGRAELQDKLADNLMNLGLAHRDFGDTSAALSCFDEAIAIRQLCVRQGQADLIPSLLRSERICFSLRCLQNDWIAAADLVRAGLLRLTPLPRRDALADPVNREAKDFLHCIFHLKYEDRRALFKALGKAAFAIYRLLVLVESLGM